VRKFFKTLFENVTSNQNRIESKIDESLKLLNGLHERMNSLEKRFNLKDHQDRQNYGHIQYKLQEVSDQKKPIRKHKKPIN
jgi:hypothetical protein